MRPMQGMFIIDVTATQRYEMKLLISKTERFIRYYRLLISDNRLITFPKHFMHKQNWNHWFLRYIYIQTYIITINYTNHKRKLFFFLFTPIKYFNQSDFLLSNVTKSRKSLLNIKIQLSHPRSFRNGRQDKEIWNAWKGGGER